MRGTILKTAIATMLGLFVLFSFGIAVFGKIAPAVMFGFTYELGLRRASAMYADMVYNRSGDEADRRRALEFAIEFGRHGRVVELFARQYDIENDEHLYATGRLRSQFVWSLLELGRYDEALAFVDYTTMTPVLDRPCYLYFVFANHSTTGISAERRAQLQREFYLYIRLFIFDFDAARQAGTLTPLQEFAGELFILDTRGIYDAQQQD